MAFKKIVVLVILMTVLVYCEVAEEFSAADDDDRGQCKAETKGQHGAEKKSLYEMFSEDEGEKTTKLENNFYLIPISDYFL